MIHAVCFDLDGLMFNTEHVFYGAGTELLQRRGHAMTRDAMNVMLGRRPLESFQALKAHLNLTESPEELLEESREIFFRRLETELQPMPGLFTLLDRIQKAGLPIGVATSSPRFYLEDLLNRFQIRDRFSVTLTSEDVVNGKPDPEIYRKAAHLLAVDVSQMLVLEDTSTGTRAGVSAGAYVISVPHEHTADHDFSGAKHIATGLMDGKIVELIPID